MDGGASICVGEEHVANWLVGQVLDETYDEERMVAYTGVVGADPGQFREALHEVTRTSRAQFRKVDQLLFQVVRQISELAPQNAVKARHIEEQRRGGGARARGAAARARRQPRRRGLAQGPQLALRTGIGISPADQERVFAQFMRAVPESECPGLGTHTLARRPLVFGRPL